MNNVGCPGAHCPCPQGAIEHAICHERVSFSFLPKGGQGQNEIVWIIWRGKQIFVCKACDKLAGSRGMLPWGNFHFGPFIRCNLVESGTVILLIYM